MNKYRLLAPGPTPVAAETALAMAVPLPHHRGPGFRQIFETVRRDLRLVFGTRQDVLVLTSSGTGGMEAAAINVLSPGDTAIVVRAGKFGQRWSEILASFGVRDVPIDIPWGSVVSADQVARALAEHPEARAVLMQATETSTGALHPVREVAAVVRGHREVALVVDGITAVGVLPMPMDEWGIDVLIAGSQKAFMIPPGLAFVALSDKAWSLAERCTSPRYYFDLRRERRSQARNETAWTPAISLVLGLRAALDQLLAEGLPAAYARQARAAEAARAAAAALGLEVVAATSPSPALTAIRLPDGIDGAEVVRRLREDHGMVVSGGQDQLKGRIVRIGHMGHVDGLDIVTAAAALELALASAGCPVTSGAAVSAAQAVLANGLGVSPIH